MHIHAAVAMTQITEPIATITENRWILSCDEY